METFEWNWKSRDGLRMYSRGWAPDADLKGILCLVHGLGEHTGRYERVAISLAAKGYALVGFDLRGHGKSEGQLGHTPSFETYFDDIDSFLGEVRNRYIGVPLFLYGHSLGAILVLAHIPLRQPDITGVISTGASLRSSLEEQRGKIALIKVLGSVWPTLTLASGLVPSTISRDTEVVKAYIEDPLVHNKVSLGWGKVMLSVIATTLRNAGKFSKPLLIMHGTKDVLGYSSGSEEFAKMVPQPYCTLKLWEGLSHEIHNEPEKEEVFNFMIHWLDEQIKK